MVGVSRSVTVVAAYLLKKYKYSLQEIFNTLRRKRSKVILILGRLILIRVSSSNSNDMLSKKAFRAVSSKNQLIHGPKINVLLPINLKLPTVFLKLLKKIKKNTKKSARKGKEMP